MHGCLDLISPSGHGHYGLLTPGFERSSPLSSRPFNDGGLAAGGLDAARGQLWSLTLDPVHSVPNPHAHMALIEKKTVIQSSVW